MNQTAIQLAAECRRLEAQNRRLTQFAQLVAAFFATDEAGHSQYIREQAHNALAQSGIVVVDETVYAPPAVVQAVAAVNDVNIPAKEEAVADATDAVLLAANAMVFSFDEIRRTEGYEKALDTFTARKRTLRIALGKYAQTKER